MQRSSTFVLFRMARNDPPGGSRNPRPLCESHRAHYRPTLHPPYNGPSPSCFPLHFGRKRNYPDERAVRKHPRGLSPWSPAPDPPGWRAAHTFHLQARAHTSKRRKLRQATPHPKTPINYGAHNDGRYVCSNEETAITYFTKNLHSSFNPTTKWNRWGGIVQPHKLMQGLVTKW